MAASDALLPRKTYIVDTSVLVSAPDALQNLTEHNTVVVPFPVLQELDRRRTAANGMGYTASSTVRFLDEVQVAPRPRPSPRDPGQRRPVEVPRRHARSRAGWPGFNAGYADDPIILLADQHRREHPAEPVILVTRDAGMRCKARARGVTTEDYYSDRPVPSMEKFYSGRTRIELPSRSAHLLSTLHHEQRLPVAALADVADLAALRPNQCCELQVAGTGKSAWGIYKNHDTPGYLRRVNTKPPDRFGPCNPEQACARDLILDDQTLVTSLVGIAGTGKTLIALLCAYELLRAGRVSRIEVYRLNAEAGREIGFLPGALAEKMAPWAKPIIDNLDFIVRRLHPGRASRTGSPTTADRREPTHPTVESLPNRRRSRSRRSTTARPLHPRHRHHRRRCATRRRRTSSLC